MTDNELKQAVKTQMGGFDSKTGYAKWNTTNKWGDGIPTSWVSWFTPDANDPTASGDLGCEPQTPWKNGDTISCKAYQDGNIFEKTGVQLDFRIAPDGIVRDVKLSNVSSYFGVETIKDLP